MTKKEKQLLLKDLCGRLPYRVKVQAISVYGYAVQVPIDGYCSSNNKFDIDLRWRTLDEFKPYLRPISSLTAEECDKLFEILNIDEKGGDWLKINDINVIRLFTEKGKDFYEIAEAMDYLYSIHVDFRDMIDKGLALEAPEGMYKNK